MNIEKVKKTKSGFIVNESTFIPEDDSNCDFRSLKNWIDSGGVVEPEFTVDEMKAAKIEELNLKFSSKIYSTYSQQKQTNLINQAVAKKLENNPEIDPEFKAMNEFISPIRSKKDQIKAAIQAANSCEELAELEIDLEDEE